MAGFGLTAAPMIVGSARHRHAARERGLPTRMEQRPLYPHGGTLSLHQLGPFTPHSLTYVRAPTQLCPSPKKEGRQFPIISTRLKAALSTDKMTDLGAVRIKSGQMWGLEETRGVGTGVEPGFCGQEGGCSLLPLLPPSRADQGVRSLEHARGDVPLSREGKEWGNTDYL